MRKMIGLAVIFFLVLVVSSVSAAFFSIENYDYDVPYRFAQVKYLDHTMFTYRYDDEGNKIYKKVENR